MHAEHMPKMVYEIWIVVCGSIERVLHRVDCLATCFSPIGVSQSAGIFKRFPQNGPPPHRAHTHASPSTSQAYTVSAQTAFQGQGVPQSFLCLLSIPLHISP